jgi:hypothetical protein
MENVECENSMFKRSCLAVDHVWWLNPNAIIENIPVPEDEESFLTVCLYHMYPDGFNMNCNLDISIAIMPEEGEEECDWETVVHEDWPLDRTDCPDDEHLR